ANVATGVIAVDEELRVTMANPRAADLLGTQLEPGNLLPRTASSEWLPVWNAVSEFLAAGTGAGREGERIAEREFDVGGRQIRVQIASLGPSPDGCVVALDDATAFTRAARVLAWGEMARQVAHEIKNPLTPIRLGIQHLLRTRHAARGAKDFDLTLEETAERILAEIDRLDAIARAFARFASPVTPARGASWSGGPTVAAGWRWRTTAGAFRKSRSRGCSSRRSPRRRAARVSASPSRSGWSRAGEARSSSRAPWDGERPSRSGFRR